MIISTKDPEFNRDMTSGALINKDIKARREYLARRKHAKRLEKLESDVKEVKGDMRAIRDLLQELVGNNK